MNREEAISLLRDMKDTYDEIHENTNYEIGYEQMTALDMAIEALSAEAEWIPCSERLPSESGNYLITVTDLRLGHRGEHTVTMADFYAMAKKWNSIVDVYAWRPLPTPYKESEVEK